jgi:hypothetical protein
VALAGERGGEDLAKVVVVIDHEDPADGGFGSHA